MKLNTYIIVGNTCSQKEYNVTFYREVTEVSFNVTLNDNEDCRNFTLLINKDLLDMECLKTDSYRAFVTVMDDGE